MGRQISVQATYIYRCVIRRRSEFGHADDTLVTCACKHGVWIRPDPLICFPGSAHLCHLFSRASCFLYVNQILGSRLQPTPFLSSLRCQNMTHGFIELFIQINTSRELLLFLGLKCLSIVDRCVINSDFISVKGFFKVWKMMFALARKAVVFTKALKENIVHIIFRMH